MRLLQSEGRFEMSSNPTSATFELNRCAGRFTAVITGRLDYHPLRVWRFVLHNQRIEPTPGGKAAGFSARRSLSATPLDLSLKIVSRWVLC